MARFGIRVIGTKGEDYLIPLLRVPSWLQIHIMSSPTLEEQLVIYLNYIDSIKLSQYAQYVETFSEEEEEDLLNLYSGNSDYYALIITEFFVSSIVRPGDPKFEELSQSLSDLAEEGEEFYSFVEVSEKPHKTTVLEKIKKFRKKGYYLKFELLEKD